MRPEIVPAVGVAVGVLVRVGIGVGVWRPPIHPPLITVRGEQTGGELPKPVLRGSKGR